jgi:hypothetical protein
LEWQNFYHPFFCGMRIWTQVFVLVMQVLFHLSHISSLYFSISILHTVSKYICMCACVLLVDACMGLFSCFVLFVFAYHIEKFLLFYFKFTD